MSTSHKLLSQTTKALPRKSLRCPSPRAFSTTRSANADFTHAVVGAGVVGLAVARKLQERDGVSAVLIEKHGAVGTETSSRNSEVIHAGLYYGPQSLKTHLCIKGKHLLYTLCKDRHIPHKNTGKWIVAQDDAQLAALQKVHAHSKHIGVPTHFLSREEARRREPDVRAEAGVLESPSTGIVDSHSLMQVLQGEFEANGGICAFKSPVTRIEAVDGGKGGWEITTSSTSSGGKEEEEATISVETVINSAGLYAIPLSNMVVPAERRREAYYAKGTYFSYSASLPKPSTLIYPAPIPGHGGLGTHLTLDMSGRVRFGPDVEWIDDPTDYRASGERLEAALDDIQSYLPGIDRSAVGLDYVGIRPKLSGEGSVTSGQGFNDFYIKKEEGLEGFVNLLGIESPGLTSALAIAEEVEALLYR